MKKHIKKKYNSKMFIFFLCIGFVLVFLTILGISYAYFVTTVKGKEFVIYTGTLAVNYTKKTNVINVDNAYPMSDEQGLELTPHEFMVTNNGNIDARYQIRLELDSTIKDIIDTRYVKLSYKINDSEYSKPVLLSDLNSSLVFVRNNILSPNNSDSIAIKLWIDLSASNDIQGKQFKARIVVDSIQNVDDGYVVDTIPIIYLNKDSNGNQDIHLKVNDNYQELGVERIEDDQDIFTPSQATIDYEYYDGTSTVSTTAIDTSKVGIYYVNYSITDKSGNVGKKTRVVTINKTSTIPSINLIGGSSITLPEDSVYIENGVSVTDNNRVITVGDVNVKLPGTYVIRYIVVDDKGNLNSLVRNVTVIGTEKL